MLEDRENISISPILIFIDLQEIVLI
jgi:hypothetical protein